MTDLNDRYEFTQDNVDKAPDEHGVYILDEDGVIINIGRAAGLDVTIRSRLQSHFAGNEGPCTQSATHYRREITENAAEREVQLLEWHQNEYDQLPRCNERIG